MQTHTYTNTCKQIYYYSVQLCVRQLALLVPLRWFSEINNVLLACLLPVLSFKGEVSLGGEEGGERGGRGVVVPIKSVTRDLWSPGTQGSPVQLWAEVCWKENNKNAWEKGCIFFSCVHNIESSICVLKEFIWWTHTHTLWTPVHPAQYFSVVHTQMFRTVKMNKHFYLHRPQVLFHCSPEWTNRTVALKRPFAEFCS